MLPEKRGADWPDVAKTYCTSDFARSRRGGKGARGDETACSMVSEGGSYNSGESSKHRSKAKPVGQAIGIKQPVGVRICKPMATNRLTLLTMARGLQIGTRAGSERTGTVQ